MRYTSKFGGNSGLKDRYCIKAKEVSVIDGKLIGEPIDRLAEYEDLEEQGLLLRLPCKVGNPVYMIGQDCDGDTLYCRRGGCDECDYLIDFVEENKFETYMLDDIGKIVFLTREEAEKALEMMKNGTNEI